MNRTHQLKNIDGFLQEKKRALPKKPSSFGNVCIRYLYLVVRRERAHDLHSKAKRLRISCKKTLTFRTVIHVIVKGIKGARVVSLQLPAIAGDC